MNPAILAAVATNDVPAKLVPLLAILLPVIILLAIWESVWKLIALWKSARHDQLAWFICLAIFNTAGILPILYILFFQKKQLPA